MGMLGIDLTVHGDTYAERKKDVRNKAITYQTKSAECDMSLDELITWSNYFAEMGARYGLLTEFRENGIC